MPRVVALETRRLNRETLVTTPIVVPDAMTRFSLIIHRGTDRDGNLWPNKPGATPDEISILKITAQLQVGRSSWLELGAVTCRGGEIVNRRGLVTESTFNLDLPHISDRLIRFIVEAREQFDLRLSLDIDDQPRPRISRFTTNTVAFVGASSGDAGAVTSLSVNHTVASGSNRFMIAFGHVSDDPPLGYDSFSSDQDGAGTEEFAVDEGSYQHHCSVRWIAPSVATHSITLSRDVDYALAMTVADFTSVDQTTPMGSWGSDNGVDPSVNVATTTGDMIISSLIADDPTISVATGTSRIENENYGPDGYSMGISTRTGNGTLAMTWNATNESYGNNLQAANINDAPAGGGANPKGPLGMPLHGPFGGPV